MGRYINTDDLLKFAFGKRKGLIHTADIDKVPSAIIFCQDCKHYELDHWERLEQFGGIPLIVAHHICMKWSDGCKTDPNGYCFMGERKDDE